jgi:hypothetical protein
MHPKEEVINEYVDGGLVPEERAEVGRHIARCETCRALADDLRELSVAARHLSTVEPPATVWRRLEPQLRKAHAGRTGFGTKVTREVAPWLAAAAALVVATVVGVRLGLPGPRHAPPATVSAPASRGDAAQSVEAELRAAEEHYDNAIKGLEQIANANQGALDPGTAATLQKNLSVIDQAIGESRAAVRAQPNSEPAQQSLLENFRTKIALLQDTVALVNEMRKGNEAGAARIVSGLKQKGE